MALRRLLAVLLLGACGSEPEVASEAPPASAEPAAAEVLAWRRDTGIELRHHRHSNPERKYIAETLGAGVAAFDYDQDGDQDLYFVQGSPLPGSADPQVRANALYRNDGDWRFTDVTAAAGVGDTGYGMGVACPDLDNDGFPDLYVVNLGANVLYRNQGDGTFRAVPEAGGLADPAFGSAAAFADIDRDGDLDAYVGNYVELDFTDYHVCRQRNLVSYCHPDTFPAAPDRLYRNDGDFSFVDISATAGVVDTTGKALAVMATDHDEDGWVDWFVANDANENFLWINQGDGTFVDEAGFLGLAVSGKGVSQSCMGTDIADADGDGDLDIFCANLGREANVLYVRVEDEFYEDQVYRTGLGEPSFFFTGFGSEFFDLDQDADLDLMVVNGHVIDVIHDLDASQTFAQVPHLYRNRGDGTFEECGAQLGAYFRQPVLGRALVTVDLDEDGDPDLVVSHNDGPPALLENRAADGNHWIGFALEGRASPRDAIGARLWLEGGPRPQVEEIHGASSYLSWQDRRVVFGLGESAQPCRLRVRWPSGREQELGGLEVDRYHTVVEPEAGSETEADDRSR